MKERGKNKMAIKMTGHTYCKCVEDYVREFICDTEADLANLPECCTGSTALVIATGDVFVVNASGEWAKFGGGAGSKWVFHDEITIPEELWGKTVEAHFSVIHKGEKYEMNAIYFWDDGDVIDFVGEETAIGDIYVVGDGWRGEEYKTITITEMAEDEAFIAWLKANATKSIA